MKTGQWFQEKPEIIYFPYAIILADIFPIEKIYNKLVISMGKVIKRGTSPLETESLLN